MPAESESILRSSRLSQRRDRPRLAKLLADEFTLLSKSRRKYDMNVSPNRELLLP